MKKRGVFVAILAALWLALPAAAATPTVSLGNGVLEVPAGQTASLSVSVADVQNLYGIEIHLRFDPAVVQVADADPNTDGVQILAGDFLSADFVAQNRSDNQAGNIDYAVTQINPSEPKHGSGTLLTIRFQGVGAGRMTQLEAVDQILTTLDGEIIPVTVINGEVRVTGAVMAGNTATSSPVSSSLTPAPSAIATTGSTARGDAPTATRAFTRTPVPLPPEVATSASSSATPSRAPITPLATQTSKPVRAAATVAPQIPATAAPSAAAERPALSSTPAAIQSTPASVARSSSDDMSRVILAPYTPEKSDAGEQPQTQPKQPSFSGLLIGAGVLISLAVIVAAVALRLSQRSRRT